MKQAVECFGTTRWSVVLACLDRQSEGGEGDKALAQLCRTYWRPIFAFVCQKGHNAADAQDLTQDFFVKIMEGNLLKLADPTRGRFRSLLLTALQNFLHDHADKQRTQKRGGRAQFVQLDRWMTEAPSQFSVSAATLARWTPEEAYDVRWAATVVENALRRLSEECESRGRRRLFDAASPYLGAERADVHYEDLAKRIKVSPETVKTLLHRLRSRYRQLLREEVAATLNSPDELEEELRYLCGVLAAAE